MRHNLAKLLGAGAIVSSLLSASAAAQTQPGPYFAGKTLTIVVGLAAGGSADNLVRGFVPYLRKHIPGQPNIIVQNMPGAGGILAFNYIFEKAKPDGLTIVYSLWDPLAQALGNQGLRGRYDQFELLAGISDVRVNYMRVDAVPGGAKKPADVMKAKDLSIGAYGSTEISGILAHMSLKTLGVPHKIVTGYRGGADVFLALQRGEVLAHNTSLATYRTRSKAFITSGEGIGVSYLTPSDAQGKYVESPDIPDMPSFQTLYKDIHGKAPSGPLWDAFNWLVQQSSEVAVVGLAPPNTSPLALEALRKAIEDAMKDPDYIADSIKRNGLPFDHVSVERGKAVFSALSSVSPDILATLRESIDTIAGTK